MGATHHSLDEMHEFLGYAGDKGLMALNTARSYRSALSKIRDTLTEQEAADVRQIDANDVFQRFVNRNRVEIAPRTLADYKRRLNTAIEEFLQWKADPAGYKPRAGTKGREQKKKTPARKESRKSPQGASNRGTETVEPQVRNAPSASILTIPFPLRSDFVASLQIPRDLSSAEAERLAAFVRTLAIDFKP